MRIPDGSVNNPEPVQYIGYRNSETVKEPIITNIDRRSQPDVNTTNAYPKNEKPPPVIDGGIIDFDPDRIRRFVQRFGWDKAPPETLKTLNDFQGKKVPIFSWDGDKAEFDFDRTTKNKKSAFGYGNTDKAKTIEPKGECTTCNSRKYVDKSNDMSVSYQTPTKLNPSTAALAIGAHEREHVYNERAKAEREGREIVSQTVTIKYSVCSECNIMYPSGGVTRTRSVESESDTMGDTMGDAM